MRQGRRGTSRLAEVLDGHARKRAAKNFPDVELGSILADGSLELDSFGVPIPVGDFLVDERFVQPVPLYTTSEEAGGAGEASFAAHSHTVPRAGTPFRPLAEGDRVLCVILDTESDAPTPYVIGRLPGA